MPSRVRVLFLPRNSTFRRGHAVFRLLYEQVRTQSPAFALSAADIRLCHAPLWQKIMKLHALVPDSGELHIFRERRGVSASQSLYLSTLDELGLRRRRRVAVNRVAPEGSASWRRGNAQQIRVGIFR